MKWKKKTVQQMSWEKQDEKNKLPTKYAVHIFQHSRFV